MIANENYAAVVVDHDVILIDFLGFELIAGCDLEKVAADAVPRSHVNVVFVINRRWNRRCSSSPVGAPKQFAAIGCDADEACARELNVLANAANFFDNNRGIFGAVFKTSAVPNQLTGLFIQRHDGAIRAPWSAEKLLAIHQG
jgi:hypothetical protein